MQSKAKTIEQYFSELPEERKEIMTELRKVILKNLPKGFHEEINYGMVGYVVPHSIFPSGYHCDPKQPLPFLCIASQKNHIAIYHMGIYANPELYNWFINEFPKHSNKKLDIGKSCIKFKKPQDVPLKLIGELISKMSVKEWVEIYQKNLRKN